MGGLGLLQHLFCIRFFLFCLGVCFHLGFVDLASWCSPSRKSIGGSTSTTDTSRSPLQVSEMETEQPPPTVVTCWIIGGLLDHWRVVGSLEGCWIIGGLLPGPGLVKRVSCCLKHG